MPLHRPTSLTIALALAALTLTACSTATAQTASSSRSSWRPAGVLGIDVSSWQPHVNWTTVKADGYKFAIVKATEGTYYKSPTFVSQWSGARRAGIVVGAYHFAVPNQSSGTAQADYFASHGGGRSPGALPGVLDIEDNPYGILCYGLSTKAMVAWISGFVTEYHQRTGWWPIINTFNAWWQKCTGNSHAFASRDGYWPNAHGHTPNPLAGGWRTYTIWQWAQNGRYPSDQDIIPTSVFAKLH